MGEPNTNSSAFQGKDLPSSLDTAAAEMDPVEFVDSYFPVIISPTPPAGSNPLTTAVSDPPASVPDHITSPKDPKSDTHADGVLYLSNSLKDPAAATRADGSTAPPAGLNRSTTAVTDPPAAVVMPGSGGASAKVDQNRTSRGNTSLGETSLNDSITVPLSMSQSVALRPPSVSQSVRWLADNIKYYYRPVNLITQKITVYRNPRYVAPKGEEMETIGAIGVKAFPDPRFTGLNPPDSFPSSDNLSSKPSSSISSTGTKTIPAKTIPSNVEMASTEDAVPFVKEANRSKILFDVMKKPYFPNPPVLPNPSGGGMAFAKINNIPPKEPKYAARGTAWSDLEKIRGDSI